MLLKLSKLLKLLICLGLGAATPLLASEDEAPRRILAIGDSLTYGYYEQGLGCHPYTLKLQELLESNDSREWLIDTQGVAGERSEQILKRLSQSLSKAKKRYDYVVILAGTNDLAYAEAQSSDILKVLAFMYQLVTSHGAIPIVVTVPEVGYAKIAPEIAQKHRALRHELNKDLRALVDNSPSGSMALVDLAANIPYLAKECTIKDCKAQADLWDDAVHFSPRGYDEFGRLVYEAINIEMPHINPKQSDGRCYLSKQCVIL